MMARDLAHRPAPVLHSHRLHTLQVGIGVPETKARGRLRAAFSLRASLACGPSFWRPGRRVFGLASSFVLVRQSCPVASFRCTGRGGFSPLAKNLHHG